VTILARAAVLVALGMLAAARGSQAQDDSGYGPFWQRPVHTGFEVGVSFPTGEFRQGFESGWDIGASLAWPLTSRGDIWLQGDFNYEAQLVTDATVNAYGASGGGASITSGTVNIVFNLRDLFGFISPYVLGGGGPYSRSVELDNYAGTSYCSSFFGFCGLYGTAAVRTRTQFVPGWDAGGGLRFRLRPLRLFVEARYNMMYTHHGNTTLVPLVLGTEL
jgi:hypothetical protein